jgi:multiple sugar transport system permease protein
MSLSQRVSVVAHGRQRRIDPHSSGYYRVRRRVNGSLFYLLLIVLALIDIIPIVWVLSTSFRTDANLFDPQQWIPHPFTFAHYTGLFSALPDIGVYIVNTLRIAVLSTIGRLLSCSLAGYAFARLRFPGKNILFLIILFTLMIPSQATLIPQYALFAYVHWINTPWPLIVPSFFGNAFATLFFRQFFAGLPRELEEAALIDGAGRWRIFFSIIVPSSRPAFLALGLLTFVGQWNGFFTPSVFLQTENQWVLTQGLQSLIGLYNSQWGEIMAGVILMSLPMALLYILVQRYFVQGITFSGIKG